MRVRPLLLALAALTAFAACDSAPAPAAGLLDLAEPWVESTPEGVGLQASAVDRAVERMEAIPRARSLLVVADGRLVTEAGFHGAGRETLHDVRSVTKSVVGLLTGIAIERGHLALDTPVPDVLSDARFRPEHDAVTVGHLLTMTGGFAWNELSDDDYARWIRSGAPVGFLLDRPLADTPGTAFTYNSAAVHLLGAAVAEAVGVPLAEFAEEALFAPLGIGPVAWEPSPDGRVNGGAGLDLRARDLARLGQLVLQDGVSGERPVVPSAWTVASTSPSQSWRSTYGPLQDYTYGRLWWTLDGPPRGALAWGYGGQFVLVVPDRDLVLVATTDWRGVSGEAGGADALEQAVLNVLLDLVDEA